MDWVCDQTWKVYVSHSVFFGSMSAGVIFFGAISDKVGRVPVMAAVYLLSGVGAVATYFSKDFYLFLLTRFIQGGVLLSICNIPFVLALVCPPRNACSCWVPLSSSTLSWRDNALGGIRARPLAPAERRHRDPRLVAAVVSP
ncbi:hypothetical protein HPB49_014122 [Dermacentor silvarum]|uniref:Uncharacterized protein n=1 Tax=Dermacentor silvarum TaxID=543639 RepID=A0ACB8CRJ9_DERSI|nr:hypothetical protein HPB49_014122 [Dermacentor silvarum]